MSSSPPPPDWFTALDREDPVPRSTWVPPGSPMYFRLRALSHSPETVHIANRMNLFPGLPDQMKYDFLRHSGAVVKRRTTGWARRPRENEADLALVSDACNLSTPKARQALRILTPEQGEGRRDWLSQGSLGGRGLANWPSQAPRSHYSELASLLFFGVSKHERHRTGRFD